MQYCYNYCVIVAVYVCACLCVNLYTPLYSGGMVRTNLDRLYCYNYKAVWITEKNVQPDLSKCPGLLMEHKHN